MKKLFGFAEFNSLRNKMILWAAIFVLPIFLVLYVSTDMATNSYEQQMLANIQQILVPFAREIDLTLNNAKLYIANKKLDLSALREGSDELTRLAELQSLGDGLSKDLSVQPQVDAIFFYTQEHLWFVQNYNRSYAQNRRAADYLESLLKAHDATGSLFQQGYLSFEADGYYLFIGLDLPGGDVIGCWFNSDTLLEQVRASGIEGMSTVMFSDHAGRMLDSQFNTPSNRRLRELLTGYFVVTERLASGPFALTALLDRSVILAPFNNLHRAMLVSLGFAFVLICAYFLFLRGSLIRPLSRLVRSIDRLDAGNFKPIPIRDSEDVEIREVYRALNAMTNEVQSLKIRVYEEKLTQQHTQMQLFQLQIRPHFFLNALNTILSYARANEYQMVQKMTLCLATHCRYILYNTWFVSVEEELVYTQNYIDMQSMQHDARYHYVVRVDDELLDREIPILAVQIFVENALKHARNAEQIQIAVGIAQQELSGIPCLCVAIDDTGAGFSPDTLAQLNNPAYMEAAPDHGIGIENVRQRLQLLYGGNAEVMFSNNEAGGAHVWMALPMERNREVRSR